MNTKIIICLVTATLLSTGSFADAQQQGKVPRIGYMSPRYDPSNPSPTLEAFRQGLRDLGYTEGKNILIEYRYTESELDRIRSLVVDLVQLNVDVLISGNLVTI